MLEGCYTTVAGQCTRRVEAGEVIGKGQQVRSEDTAYPGDRTDQLIPLMDLWVRFDLDLDHVIHLLDQGLEFPELGLVKAGEGGAQFLVHVLVHMADLRFELRGGLYHLLTLHQELLQLGHLQVGGSELASLVTEAVRVLGNAQRVELVALAALVPQALLDVHWMGEPGGCLVFHQDLQQQLGVMARGFQAEQAMVQYHPVLLLQLCEPSGNGPFPVDDPSRPNGLSFIVEQREVKVFVAYINSYIVHVLVDLGVSLRSLQGLSKGPWLDDSNRPLCLIFYLSTGSEGATGPDNGYRSLAYHANWFTCRPAQFPVEVVAYGKYRNTNRRKSRVTRGQAFRESIAYIHGELSQCIDGTRNIDLLRAWGQLDRQQGRWQ